MNKYLIRRKTLFIIAFLILGILLRLIITWDGKFYFTMDAGRDMVDVREMVVLQKMRLIGPTSAIDGFYNGPAWYYLLSLLFVVSGGDPYAPILMEIILWAIGGFFLLKIAARWGIEAIFLVGCLWVASNFVLLGSQYAFNPNPIIFLTPPLIFLLERYLQKNELIVGCLMWFLAGLFLHFEMAVGIFIVPIIILAILLITRKIFKTKSFWVGVGIFGLTLLPQIIFDLRHQEIMSSSLIHYLGRNISLGQTTSPWLRLPAITDAFYSTLLPTLMNFKLFTNMMVIAFLAVLFHLFKKGRWRKDKIALIAVLFILIPFVGFIFLPVTVNRWHLDAAMVATILFCGFVLKVLAGGLVQRAVGFIILGSVVSFALINVGQYLQAARGPNMDPSLLRNEIAAIDHVYRSAKGKNFKVYSYLPSVYDYPYQYLFWWWGLKNYGYLPQDYAYLPDKPPYISQKDKFNSVGYKPSSGLIFLIKQPDDTGVRHLWENSFRDLPLMASWQIGPLIVETRKEATQAPFSR